MASIECVPLRQAGTGEAAAAGDPWPGIVAQALDWGRAQAVCWRDAVFLVPMAPHLPLARRAWARLGGWMPRVETTRTLAHTLSVPSASTGQPLALSFDATADRLAATRLLRGQSWAAEWAERDARGWTQALDALVATAHAYWRAAAALPPDARDGHWQRSRGLLPLASRDGPGSTERALLRIAFEWAQAAIAVAPPVTDVLFALTPSAWVCVQAGGADPLVDGVMEAAVAGMPCLRVDADPPSAEAFARPFCAAPLQVGRCNDFEDEAQRAAAQVLGDLASADASPSQPPAARLPVALISLDRMLVRRIRALLARRGVAIADETGWTLSTTRAAASLAGLLAAVRPDASADELLNGLRGCAAGWPGLKRGGAALASLDATIRRRGWRRAAAIDAARLPPASAALWQAVREAGALFDAGPPRRSLAGWMYRLHALLDRCGLAASLNADEAGRQVLAALDDSAALAATADGGVTAADAAFSPRTGAVRPGFAADPALLPREQFVGWLDQVLESATFVPAAPAAPQVVITPLARAMLRPFAAIVVPGADDRHLGGAPPRQPLLSDAEAAGFGLPDAAWHRQRETLAFSHLLRVAPVSVLHRHDDAGEPLAASPLLARAMAAVPWRQAVDHRVEHGCGVAPVARPLPAAPALLPARLSASACEALRACPYRFFALRVLGLKESPELDDAVEKRDYGSWLHAVLYRFHAERAAREPAVGAAGTATAARPDDAGASPPAASTTQVAMQPPADADADTKRLHAIANDLQREQGLDAAAFLPYRASFDRFVPRYLDWLRRRDAAGARWLDGEREFSVAPAGWGGTQMHGVVERIDSLPRTAGADGPATQLIDYKTGAAQTLRTTAKRPQEDTQLAFYAGLLMTRSAAVGGAGELAAMYLALDESDALRELPHADVEATARQLIDGIGGDLARLRAGAAMPALGAGRACTFCEARGLCRRDQWAPA